MSVVRKLPVGILGRRSVQLRAWCWILLTPRSLSPCPPCVETRQAVQMTTDVVGKPDSDAMTLDDFGVKPYKMEEVGIPMLMRYRRVQHFGLVKGYH